MDTYPELQLPYDIRCEIGNRDPVNVMKEWTLWKQWRNDARVSYKQWLKYNNIEITWNAWVTFVKTSDYPGFEKDTLIRDYWRPRKSFKLEGVMTFTDWLIENN